MKWEDDALLLSTKSFGERSLIAFFFAKNYGKTAGLLKPTKHQKSFLQPGSFFKVTWTARLEEHLGTWTIDPLAEGSSGILLSQPFPLCAMISALSLVETFIPEAESHPLLYDALERLITCLKNSCWFQAYFDMEKNLLSAAGFQLHLHQCAATGATENLVYVSPRSGRAVCGLAGKPYHDKMLMMPDFLKKDTPVSKKDLLDALHLTEYFFERYITGGSGKSLPFARQRFKEILRKGSGE